MEYKLPSFTLPNNIVVMKTNALLPRIIKVDLEHNSTLKVVQILSVLYNCVFLDHLCPSTFNTTHTDSAHP